MSKACTASVFAIVALILTAGPTTAADSINCEVDRNAAERTICRHYKLLKYDAKITAAYSEIADNTELNPRFLVNFRSSQRDFLARRDACGWDVACLEAVMAMRLTRINDWRP